MATVIKRDPEKIWTVPFVLPETDFGLKIYSEFVQTVFGLEKGLEQSDVAPGQRKKKMVVMNQNFGKAFVYRIFLDLRGVELRFLVETQIFLDSPC